MRIVRRIVVTALLLAILLVMGCRTSLLGQSIWIRPATSFASRAVDVGDAEQVVLPEYDPPGDSMFVVIRVYPEDKKDTKKLTGANIRKWPEMIRKKIGKATED